MQITQIKLKNFRAFKDVEMRDIPKFAVIIGANGTGKSTLFQVFGFLRDAMTANVTTALAKPGGSRGIHEVRSRGTDGDIEIEDVADESQLNREEDVLKSPDLLAIKGLAQFERFPAVVALGNLIEQWHVSDFHISRARPEQESGYAEHLSREGENLSLVIEYLHNQHKEIFDTVVEKLKSRVPGISNIESKQTEEGRILLKFQDGAFEDPFLARYVSDGTIKMLAYLTLLYDPEPHPLLCVEEPENQLYPSLLLELAEEFREYSHRGGQVFVSSHSPDFLNGIELEEVFWLKKVKGYTQIVRASDDEQIAAYMADGDKMGYLWKQGFFEGADPQ